MTYTARIVRVGLTNGVKSFTMTIEGLWDQELTLISAGDWHVGQQIQISIGIES